MLQSKTTPGLPLTHKRPSFLVQLIDILSIELTNWRWSWRSTLFIGVVAPLFLIIVFTIFARDSGRDALSYVLIGNVVLSLTFGMLGNINSHVLFMRFRGILDYFATLPIWRPILILAVLLAFLLLSLPSTLVTIILGSLLQGISLQVSLLVVLVVPLCSLPLAAIGALIGSRARNVQEAGAIQYIVTFVLLGIGPVMVPPQKLPTILLLLGRLSPATYAVSALRQVLLGPVTYQLAIDMAVLAGFTITMFFIVNKTMSWRHTSGY